jgi:hypothetical protein
MSQVAAAEEGTAPPGLELGMQLHRMSVKECS